MKTLILLLAICFFQSQTYFSQSAGTKINSYSMDVKVIKSSPNININAECSITPDGNSPGVQLIFSSVAKIKNVSYQKGKSWVNLPYKVNGKDSLLIKTKGPFKKDKNYFLRFAYSFPAGKLNDTLLMLDRGHRWYPLIMDQIVPFKIKCEVPAGYSVLSAGNLTDKKEGKKNIFIWESKLPVFKIPLVIFNPAKFKKESDRRADIYSYSINSEKANQMLGKINGVMDYGNATYGEYTFNKLTLIEVKEFPGVNVCSGLLMVGTQSLKAICNGDDDLLYLPVVQQWFAAGVFAKYGTKGFFFLTISLPHYLRLMYIRQNMGEEAYNKALTEPLAGYKEFAGKEKDIPLIDVDAPNTREKGMVLYAKGPYIISKIENEMERKQFETLLKCLYSEFNGEILTLAEFEKYLAKDDEQGEIINLFRKLISSKGIN
jgi:hypothetical protein